MKFTNKDIFEKILEPMGLKIEDRIEIEGGGYNPYTITKDYRVKDKEGDILGGLVMLVSQDFHKLLRTKE